MGSEMVIRNYVGVSPKGAADRKSKNDTHRSGALLVGLNYATARGVSFLPPKRSSRIDTISFQSNQSMTRFSLDLASHTNQARCARPLPSVAMHHGQTSRGDPNPGRLMFSKEIQSCSAF
jgi:hypothetical protein